MLATMAAGPLLCGHDARRGGGFIEYEAEQRTLLDRVLRRPGRVTHYRYCQNCAGAFRRLFTGFWEGRLTLPEVETGLRELRAHESERELRAVLRQLRAFAPPEETTHAPAA